MFIKLVNKPTNRIYIKDKKKFFQNKNHVENIS